MKTKWNNPDRSKYTEHKDAIEMLDNSDLKSGVENNSGKSVKKKASLEKIMPWNARNNSISRSIM